MSESMLRPEAHPGSGTPSGLPSVGRLAWGSHLCHFYRADDDLAEALVAFFAAGLAAGERCLWVTCAPLEADAAREALAARVPDLDAHLAAGRIQIVDHHAWYLAQGDLGDVLASWLDMEDRALADGFTGLRISGNTLWLDADTWDSFQGYEAQVHRALHGRRIVALCSYHLGSYTVDHLLQVLRTHSMALARHKGRWQVIQTATQLLTTVGEPPDRHARKAERARLQRAEATARAAQDRLARLQRVTSALSEAARSTDVGRVIALEMCAALEADQAILAVPSADGAELVLVGHAGLRDETAADWKRFPLSAPMPVARAFREREAVWLPTREALVAAFPNLDYAPAQAIVCMPLIVRGRCLGAIGFGFLHARPFDAYDRALADDLARQAALALERVQLFDASRRAHARLQLLSDVAAACSRAELNAQQVLDAITGELTRAFGSRALLMLVEGDEGLRLASVRDAEPDREARFRAVTSRVPPRLGDWIVGEVVATGRPVLLRDASTDGLHRILPEYREMVRALEVGCILAVPLRDRGRVLGVLAVARDQGHAPFEPADEELLQELADRAAMAIEHARLYAEAQAHRQQAEQASRAKDEFLAMLGHELRNPLSPIVTAMDLMRMKGGDAFARERAIVERQVHHLLRLVEDLLDVSRIAGGKIRLRLEPHELGPIVTNALETASAALEERGHHVEVDVPDEGLRVLADPHRLTQAVVNLLTNAARYTPPGGHILVRAAREGDRILLSVRDDGVGIDADLLPRVFHMFVQDRQSLDRARGGLGLGLAIVRAITELHQGSVGVQSAGPGEGSTFTLDLPVHQLSGSTGDARGPIPSPNRGNEGSDTLLARRILVVDDNVDAAEVLAEALAAMGYATRRAHDGPSALALLAEFQPELALLDIGLPGMDGYELAGRIRSTAGFEACHLVALTGYGRAQDRQRTRAAGFHAHLVKPIDLDQLERTLADLLG